MNFPFFPQLDSRDCGPTCLRMIAKQYGKNYSLQGLRERCTINREGVSLLGISEAAENIGFRSIGVNCRLPIILIYLLVNFQYNILSSQERGSRF